MFEVVRPMLKLTAALAAAAGAGCVAYPAYDTAPGRVYYEGGGPAYCDPYYGPCTTTYYHYDYYGYPPAYGYPPGYPTYIYIDGHRRPPHYRDDGHRGGGHRGGGHRDDDRDRPVTSPLVPIRPPSDRRPPSADTRKPPVVYAPKPPRTVPGDRRAPRDPGPSVRSVRSPEPIPGRVVSAMPQPQPASAPKPARPAAAALVERAPRIRQPAAAPSDQASESRQRLRQILD